MALYQLQLSFCAPLRIGMPGRDDQATRQSIPSDQLFSWLSLGWIALFGKEDFLQLLNDFISGSKPWIHSDLFPHAGNTIWLPAPRDLKQQNDTSIVDKKSRTPWVTWESFWDAAAGNELSLSDYGRPVQAALLENVRIKRGDERDNTPFYTGVVIANDGTKATETTFAGLFKFEQEDILPKLQSIIDYMKDLGMGGNRSSGLGQISKAELRPAPKAIPAISGASKYMLLSSCYPTQKMLERLQQTVAGANSYTLVPKAGWIYNEHGGATDVRKPTTYLFDTGSIFSVEPEGQMIDVSNRGFASYRYAIPFVIQI